MVSGGEFVAAVVLGITGLILQGEMKRARARGDDMRKAWVQIIIVAAMLGWVVYATAYL